MRILVVGSGSIGARHIRNLNGLNAGEIAACDIDEKRLFKVREECSLEETYTSLDVALDSGFDAVLVCTPPNTHINVAAKALEHGAHVFIEKPLSDSMVGVESLIRRASRMRRVLAVGYNFRFHHGLAAVKESLDKREIGAPLSVRAHFGQYLPDWRPWQDYKKSYTARRDLGGGIILDGSHEIDYTRWLLGDVREVFCFAENATNLEAKTEGIAEILLRFRSGCLGEIHLDFVRPGYSRGCEVVGEDGVIRWDYKSNTAERYAPESKKWVAIHRQRKIQDMYVAEMKNFVASTKGLEKPLVTGAEGQKSLRIALAAKESAATRRVIKL